MDGSKYVPALKSTSVVAAVMSICTCLPVIPSAAIPLWCERCMFLRLGNITHDNPYEVGAASARPVLVFLVFVRELQVYGGAAFATG